MSKVISSKKMVNLNDFRKTIPKGGLLSPSLRKGKSVNVNKINPMKGHKGNFKNVLGQ